MLTPNGSPQGAIKSITTIALFVYSDLPCMQSFQVIVQAKLVNFAVLVALFCCNIALISFQKLLELCDNLDNKIIKTINFIVIKIIIFYYRDNSKFLDITQKEYISTRSNYRTRHAYICHYIICCYCIMITIVINVRFIGFP